jgi:dienelactone hydrolase
MTMRKALTLAGLAVISTVAQGQPAPAPPARPAPPPVTTGSGPWPAQMEVDPRLDFHVVYRPIDLGGMGSRKLGVMVWGNGGCRDDGASARAHLTEVASHGYLVIAPGKLYGPEESAPIPRRGPDGRYPPQATTAEQVRAGIDWAVAENKRRESHYHGRIDPAAIAVAGHSCGGLQALQVAPDPRIKTVLVHNSGIFNTGSSITGLDLDKASLTKIHTPIIYILGGATDQALPNGADDFARIDHVPAVLVDLPVGHGGTFYKRDGGDVAQIAIDWLDWQLRGDAAAARTFTGINCRLCLRSDVSIAKKRID